MWSKKQLALIAALVLVLDACAGATGPTQSPPASSGTPAGGPPGGTAEATVAGGGGAGECVAPGTGTASGSVDGSVTTSGAYPATWTFVVGNNGVSTSGRFGLTSDNNGPEANLSVDAAGNVEFGPISPGPAGEDLPINLRQLFTGTGGQATICRTTDEVPLAYTCAVTVDSDVTEATTGAMLHVKGTLTVNGTIGTTSGYTITC